MARSIIGQLIAGLNDRNDNGIDYSVEEDVVKNVGAMIFEGMPTSYHT